MAALFMISLDQICPKWIYIFLLCVDLISRPKCSKQISGIFKKNIDMFLYYPYFDLVWTVMEKIMIWIYASFVATQ